jgi:hypothetical protein
MTECPLGKSPSKTRITADGRADQVELQRKDAHPDSVCAATFPVSASPFSDIILFHEIFPLEFRHIESKCFDLF